MTQDRQTTELPNEIYVYPDYDASIQKVMIAYPALPEYEYHNPVKYTRAPSPERAEPVKLFPIQKFGTVPWYIAQFAYAAYAKKYGSSQTLERLAERGGFYVGEMDELFPAWRDEVRKFAALSQQPTQPERDAVKFKPTHRHKKRGTDYQIIGKGKAQTINQIYDDEDVVIYRDENGLLWVRSVDEFEDGRFEAIKAAEPFGNPEQLTGQPQVTKQPENVSSADLTITDQLRATTLDWFNDLISDLQASGKIGRADYPKIKAVREAITEQEQGVK